MPANNVLRQRTQAVAATLNNHRILLYSILSTIAVSAAIANALKMHSNFYSVAIYLSKSSRSVLVLANFSALLALLSGHVVQLMFFGALRPPEIERLYDRLWFFITESLLAFTIFRDEFDAPFAIMFGFLLFVKSFHWLAADRIEWMDQRPYPGPPPLFHIRMSTLFLILLSTDFIMFIIAVENTVAHGVGGMVLFASEYAILMASVTNTMSKYLLSAYELRRAGQRGGENAPPWENKSMWTFYIELVTDFLKLTTYLVFFTLIITFYGLPLNIIRDVYITARSFITRLRALHRYQTATRNMDQRYPNATEAEMAAMSDRTCIICREEMLLLGGPIAGQAGTPQQAPGHDGPNTTPKKLPCGHIFHFHCLRSWLERQQSCPTCRRTVLDVPQGQQQAPGEAPRDAGAIPPAQNPPGAPGAQPGQPQGNNNNIPRGLMDRIFGNPVQAPLVPGQFAQPPFAQPQNLPNPPLNVGQGPVVINYHIQYQQQRQPPQPQQPQQLQPPPQFRGFQGPGGEWHAWGDVRPPNPAQNFPQPTLRQQDIAVPTPTVPAPAEAPTTSPPESAASTEAPAVQEADNPADPREAAALAALRRFGAGPSRPTPVSRTSSSTASGSNRISPPPTESSSSSSVTSHAPQSDVTPNGTASGAHSRPEIPSLIPLYDYNTIGSHGTIRPSFPRAPSAPSYPSPHPQVQSTSGSRAPALRAAAEARRTPMPQLPPTMTDEQLAVMDRLTREAIDERLRVLEGVSGAVYRCIDELMRMRSALPPQTAPPPAVNTTAASPTAPTADSEDLPGLSVQPPTTPQTSVASGSKSEGQADEQDGDSSSSSDCSCSNEEENGAL